MKRTIKVIAFMMALTLLMASCYTLSYDVGRGAQSGVEVKKQNIYLIGGLVPITTYSPKDLAGGASNYTVTITHSFMDGLLTSITAGIFAPTTIIVKK
jgi:predicted small secreted protein